MKKDREDSSRHPSSSVQPSAPIHRPSKRFGQNFLTDKTIIKKIVAALNPQPNETIVEIGPGRGALTLPLIELAGQLVAIEFDRNLIPILIDAFGEEKNFGLSNRFVWPSRTECCCR